MNAVKGVDAYPLCWPAGRKRTESWRRAASRFGTSFAVARDEIVSEVARLKHGRASWKRANDVIVSTNLQLRRDGLPLAGQRQPEDPGVAVYFERCGKQFAFACDRWKRVEDNMHAVCLTISALRGIERWGTGDMVEAAFTGFAALPAPGADKTWRSVLGVAPAVRDIGSVRDAYRRAASAAHPDKGGSNAAMAAVNAAWAASQQELEP